MRRRGPEALKAWVEQSAKDLGGIDVYVSNASAGGGPDWDAHYAIDMMGTVNGVEAALPSLTESDAASVVIVSTSAAVEAFPPPPMTSAGAYGAMKAAQLNYSSFAAQQHAAAGIRFNVVSPGPTYFEGSPWVGIEERMPPFFEAVANGFPLRNKNKPDTLPGHLGTGQEVANVAASSPVRRRVTPPA